jgi:peptidoglycan hydrolase CwlO-like protein
MCSFRKEIDETLTRLKKAEHDLHEKERDLMEREMKLSLREKNLQQSNQKEMVVGWIFSSRKHLQA